MSRIALLEPQCTDQADALLARTASGDAAPIGPIRTFAGNLPMTGAVHGWGRYESDNRPTPLAGGRHA